jgi:hypothetical protein
MTDPEFEISELTALERRLDDERPQLTAMQLDGIRSTVRTRASRPKPRGAFMKSRLAIASALCLGILFSGTGVSLGVSALNESDSAAVKQYGAAEVQGEDGDGAVLGSSGSGSDTPPGSGSGSDLQGSGQTSAGNGGELAFTGYAAIPILLIGVGLFAAGLLMRRSARETLPDGTTQP